MQGGDGLMEEEEEEEDLAVHACVPQTVGGKCQEGREWPSE